MAASNQAKDLELLSKYQEKAKQKSLEKGVPHFWKLSSSNFGPDSKTSKKLSILTLAGAPQLFKKERKEGRVDSDQRADFVYYPDLNVAGRPSEISALLTRIGRPKSVAEILRESHREGSNFSAYKTQRQGTRTSVTSEQMAANLDKFYDTVMAIKTNLSEIKASVRGSSDGKETRAAKSPRAKKTTTAEKKTEKKSPRGSKKSPAAKTPKEGVFERFSGAIADKGFNVTESTMKKATKPISFDDTSKPVPRLFIDGKEVYLRLTSANAGALQRFVSEVLDPNSNKMINLVQPGGHTVAVTAGALATALRSYTYPTSVAKTNTRSKKTPESAADLNKKVGQPAVSRSPRPSASSSSSAARSSPPRAQVASKSVSPRPSASSAAPASVMSENVAPSRVSTGRRRAPAGAGRMASRTSPVDE